MRVALNEMGRLMSLDWQGLAEIGGLAGAATIAWCKMRRNKTARRREQRIRRQLEEYAQLDVRFPQDGDLQKLSLCVSQMVSESSAFKRVGMLVRDAEGRLYVGGSLGV